MGLLTLAGLAIFLFILAYGVTLFLGKSSLSGDKIAVIKIEGVILDSRPTLEELKEYRENPSVKAILLRIDSPGGAVAPSQEIYEEVKKIRDENRTKVVVSMGSVAASGGYYIASASHKIVANPGTITGSIGVILELANVSGLMKKVGVESVVIKAGKFKDVGSVFRGMTPEERAILQGVMDNVHDQFIGAVADGRGMDPAKVRSLSDGRIFSGEQAKKLGLVDEIGNYEDAVRIAAGLAGIKGVPRVVEKKPGFSLWSALTGASSLSELVQGGVVPPFFRMSYLFSY
ncbi:MAG: signal peptide peptidase SppA [Nitrospirae bacterium]|nr:signal peptide peptidase SppA [Nitrospirota bacterium]